MLVHLQFVITVPSGTALAWPREVKHLGLTLTHEPLTSTGYGSEEVALEDLSRYSTAFPCIQSAECIVYAEEPRDAS